VKKHKTIAEICLDYLRNIYSSINT